MLIASRYSPLFFFFNDTATTEIYPLPLHDALPIPFDAPASGASARFAGGSRQARVLTDAQGLARSPALTATGRSEEHTSELQSQSNLVCRLLLEKKKTIHAKHTSHKKC